MFFQLSHPSTPSLSLYCCNISLSYLNSAILLSILIFRFLALTPSSLLFFIHSSPSLAFPLFSSLPCANVDVCLLLYPCLFLSFSLAFPPLANIIPFFHPFSLPLQNGSRQSGRSSNTPACGSRRVCPSAASTLADDSSSRSFERRPASLFLPFSFSFSFFLSFSLSFFSSLFFSLPILAFFSLLFPRVHFERSTFRLIIERRSIYLPSGYGTHPSD